MASFIVGYIFLIAGNSALMLVFLNSLSIFLSLIFQDFVAYILFAVGFHSLAKKYPAFGKAKILSYVLAVVSTLAYLLSLAVPPLSAIVVGLFISVCVLLTRLYLMYMTVNVISGLDTDMFKSLDSGSLRTWWFIACVLHILCWFCWESARWPGYIWASTTSRLSLPAYSPAILIKRLVC